MSENKNNNDEDDPFQVILERVKEPVPVQSTHARKIPYLIKNGQYAGQRCVLVRFCQARQKNAKDCFNMQSAGNGYCNRHAHMGREN